MGKQKVENKALATANETALKGFPKAKLKGAFNAMAELAKAGDAANEARQAAALDVVMLAENFAVNNDAPVETLVKGWRDNLKLVIMELATSGNRFAELTEGKGDAPATAKLTGYGNNVASIAKGVIEFDIHCDGKLDSYRECRKAVESARAEKRRSDDPGAAQLADAKAHCMESWDTLRTTVFETGDILNVQALTEVLDGHIADVLEQIAAQDATEAEAEAA